MPAAKRVFFALKPGSIVRGKLEAASRRIDVGGRIIPAKNLHLTLVFVGNINERQLACLKQAAGNVNTGPFSLQLDCYGYFGRRALWLGCRNNPAALQQLHDALSVATAERSGFQAETRPYVPHVTLRRNLPPEAPARSSAADPAETIKWPVKSFSLMLSEQNQGSVHYKELAQWTLR